MKKNMMSNHPKMQECGKGECMKMGKDMDSKSMKKNNGMVRNNKKMSMDEEMS